VNKPPSREAERTLRNSVKSSAEPSDLLVGTEESEGRVKGGWGNIFCYMHIVIILPSCRWKMIFSVAQVNGQKNCDIVAMQKKRKARGNNRVIEWSAREGENRTGQGGEERGDRDRTTQARQGVAGLPPLGGGTFLVSVAPSVKQEEDEEDENSALIFLSLAAPAPEDLRGREGKDMIKGGRESKRWRKKREEATKPRWKERKRRQLEEKRSGEEVN
jgi:hypothetical protein